MGLVAPRHLESSRTRDGTCALCVGRQILNHWTTREVHVVVLILPQQAVSGEKSDVLCTKGAV